MIPYDAMTTLSTILEKLRLKKMDNEFRWVQNGLTTGEGKIYSPEELTIVKIYRFEGASDPSDSCILYILEANDGLKGYSLNAYGMYSSHEDVEGYDNFIRQVKIENRDGQLLFEI